MRFYVIDDLRALAIINMILYHGIFDLVYIFGIKLSWFTGIWGFIWEQYICFSFILIAGFCQAFARFSLKEGLIVSLCGIIISIVTIIIHLEVEIYFGVLTFIGLAILITIPLKRFYRRINPLIGLTLTILLFLFSRNFMYGYAGFGPFNFYEMPSFLYRDSPGWILTLIGFPYWGFSSADYFPFIPWYFLFLFGYYLYYFLKRNNCLYYLVGQDIPVLTWISKHSLIIYMLHQPIIYGFLALLFYFN